MRMIGNWQTLHGAAASRGSFYGGEPERCSRGLARCWNRSRDEEMMTMRAKKVSVYA